MVLVNPYSVGHILYFYVKNKILSHLPNSN